MAVWRDHKTETFMIMPPLIIATTFCFGLIIFHSEPKAKAPGSLSNQRTAPAGKTTPLETDPVPTAAKTAETVPADFSKTTPQTTNPQASTPTPSAGASSLSPTTPNLQTATPNTSNPSYELSITNNRSQHTSREIPIVGSLKKKLAQ